MQISQRVLQYSIVQVQDSTVQCSNNAESAWVHVGVQRGSSAGTGWQGCKAGVRGAGSCTDQVAARGAGTIFMSKHFGLTLFALSCYSAGL